MLRVLLLNADWSPLQFISDVRALRLLMRGRAEVITISDSPSFWDSSYNTVSNSFQVPATIRLYSRVNINPAVSRFRKVILYNRDNWSCQYCQKRLGKSNITIDHVVPKCRGGKTTWKNCVVCCKTCNRNKGAKLPQEVNMQLLKQPIEPRIIHFWNLSDKKDWHKDWEIFIVSSITSQNNL
ncbi:MAG: HNH endonuclease [Chlamydiae bacterium]|nr:HNH endonuclease [Chlamydiota bacterium]